MAKKPNQNPIHQELRKVFNNQKREGTILEKKLGSSAKVHAFAQFYQQNAEEIAVVAAGALYEYTSDTQHVVDTKDVIAFKEGLGVICSLFEQCFKEIELKRIQESTPDTVNTAPDVGP